MTSELTLREIERYRGVGRKLTERTFRLLEKVPVVAWDKLLGMHSYGDALTWINSPMIQRDELYTALLGFGLEVVDAQHVFVAAKQDCDVFLTCDGGVLARATRIRQLFELAVQKEDLEPGRQVRPVGVAPPFCFRGHGRRRATLLADDQHYATPKKLTAEYLTGLVTDEGKAESCRTLTQLPELPSALLRVVAVGTGIAIHEVALEHVIHEDGQLARRGRDRLRLSGAGGQATVEGPEGGLRPSEAGRGESKRRGRAIGRGLRLRAEELAAGHLILGGER